MGSIGKAIVADKAPPPETTPTGAAPIREAPRESNLHGAWTTFLSKPENQAFLIQTGMNMLQPYGIGQTAGGAIARSLGAGMEARDRSLKSSNDRVVSQSNLNQQQRQNRQTDRELDIREKQVNALSGIDGVRPATGSARLTDVRVREQQRRAAAAEAADRISFDTQEDYLKVLTELLDPTTERGAAFDKMFNSGAAAPTLGGAVASPTTTHKYLRSNAEGHVIYSDDGTTWFNMNGTPFSGGA